MRTKILIFSIIFFNLVSAEEAKPDPNTFIDKDGDTIIIIDSKIRNEIAFTKSIKPDHIYDNSDIEIKRKTKEIEKSLNDKEKKNP